MAASDKPFRSQRSLDMVFAVSNILMLLSCIWMLWQDYAREFKTEQRVFREVEVAMAQQYALANVPSLEEFDAAKKGVEEAVKNQDKSAIENAMAALQSLQPQKERAEARYQFAKADVDSKVSFLNIAKEHGDDTLVDRYRKELDQLNGVLVKEQADRDEIASKIRSEQVRIAEANKPLNDAVGTFKKVNDRFDSQVKLALNKRWTVWDALRTMPVINGFADPLKIQQFTINDVPIDYNFKYVTRFDRCMSCHVGIDRPSFTKSNLEALTQEDANKAKLAEAQELYDKRIEALTPAVDKKELRLIPNPHKLTLSPVPASKLTRSRINEFAGHPRLDLFVGSNSKHPAEKLGCSACHAGQGSGTSFLDASHTPNNSTERAKWAHDKGWAPDHMWDFPMLPTRFIESSCLKCHHEVTDLISTDNRVEAPKLLRGYALIKENGCFGCHEISGWKSGQRVGPDLRLEPSPPLEDLTPLEKARAELDPDNRPGNLRKIGPALTRVSEKVSEEWIKKWLYSPSSFRPDTKMPHYYNLSTNSKEFLAKNAPSQEKFPNTEMASIAYFLVNNSKQYLDNSKKHHGDNAEARHRDEMRLMELLNLGRLNKEDSKELDDVKMRIKLRKLVPLVDPTPKDYKAKPDNGRVLFTERGCLACHTHDGTGAANAALKIPELKSDAVFGPNLSQLKGKLLPGEAGKKWLVQWILNPQLHSPRSRMPVTHLSNEEAADVAAWLLSQSAENAVGPDWENIKVTEPTPEDLKNLARVYLETRMMSKADTDKYLSGTLSEETYQLLKSDLPKEEYELYPKIKAGNFDELKSYLGKKAVSRLGCYACHDIPGFENAKPIGVGLNDWGKKAPERLAFEDIGNFYQSHYYPVEKLTGNDGVKDGKEPYEEFYAQLIPPGAGHAPTRAGYLNQKVRDPRSYDYNRLLAWDDRARMPKFHFARPRMQKEEEPDAFQARIFKEEAEAREAVATFVLGLTTEMVPSKSINQPAGDRLAEVKGRQILDKYNCNGCHLIRPGSYDFKLGPKTLEKLEFAHRIEKADMTDQGEIVFPNHTNWVGNNPPTPERLTAHGVQPKLTKIDTDDGPESFMILRLSEALRYPDAQRIAKNIPASKQIFIALPDLTPNPSTILADADIDWYFSSVKPYGGAFANLLVPYLNSRDPKKYAMSDNDSPTARASLPPSLMSQGERTQSDWLYQFLLNPTKVRKLAILRMPKFNMSKEEAKTLVDYFAAVTRQMNPGVGLPYPFESLPQQDDMDSPYWRQKTKEYVDRLRASEARDMDGKLVKGKDGKGMTSFQQRVNELTPLWEKISKQQEASINAEVEKLKELAKARAAEVENKEKALKNAQGKEATDLKADVDALKEMIEDGKAEVKTREAALKKLDVKALQETWAEKEAYAADGYRMLTSRKLCLQCHQIGSFLPSEKDKQGPPLALANQRLRPNWIVYWVDKPQRFVPYTSLMPTYFSETKLKYQSIHAGPALEQIQALRDVLINLPRIAEMPINRLYNPDLPADKK